MEGRREKIEESVKLKVSAAPNDGVAIKRTTNEAVVQVVDEDVCVVISSCVLFATATMA